MDSTESIPPAGHNPRLSEVQSQSLPNVQLDVVGGPWAIIESDPGIFTSVMRKLGIKRCEAAEVYSIEADGLAHLDRIHGLVFCSQVQAESELKMHDLTDDGYHSDNPDAGEIWFANQLIHNACATQAILNVIFNCPQVDVGPTLRNFQEFTRNMGSKNKGLALSNDAEIRNIHNSMARPGDLRDALHSSAKRTALTDAEKRRLSAKLKRKNKKGGKKKKKTDDEEEDEDEDEDSLGDTDYHYVGYVPFQGKVWELDGLRVGPLEVGEIASNTPQSSREWLDIARPAIRMKIQSLQKSGNDVRFNLLAIVEDGWQKRSDEFELLRRENRALARRLDELDSEWKGKLPDQNIHNTVEAIFSAREDPGAFDPSFGHVSSERSRRALTMPEGQALSEWRRCYREAQSVSTLLREEDEKAHITAAEHVKRTHNYEDFFRAFTEALSEAGHLLPVLGLSNPTSNEREANGAAGE